MSNYANMAIINILVCRLKFPSPDLSNSRLIKTYFINKNFDLKNPICINCPQIECLYSLGNYRIPDDISMCARYIIYNTINPIFVFVQLSYNLVNI